MRHASHVVDAWEKIDLHRVFWFADIRIDISRKLLTQHCDHEDGHHDNRHQPPKPMNSMRDGFLARVEFSFDKLVVV